MTRDMNDTYVKHFADEFIRKNRRERILYELMKPEKRYDGISRFCHQAGQLLDPARIIMEGEDLDSREAFMSFVGQHSESCLVLSLDPRLDGQFLSFEETVNYASVCSDAVLILGSTFAVVFGEPIKGGREKYLLSEK